MAEKIGTDAFLHHQTLLSVDSIVGLSDGQLLERFATGRGVSRERAFATLVERHGSFVLRVCCSVLRDEHAAEDAFQATFLVLARKAESLWVKQSLAPWLHQAAYRAAAHDRSALVRRRSHELAASGLRAESTGPPDQRTDGDLERIIHEEIDRLPGRFRVAVVLCDLEGRTHEQAARELQCAVGTVKSRLARGRKRLRGRLVRRGVAPATATAWALAGEATRPAVRSGLAESTITYAATGSVLPTSVAVLTEGVLISMFLTKLKLATTPVAIVVAIAVGGVALAQSGLLGGKEGAGGPAIVGSPVDTSRNFVVGGNASARTATASDKVPANNQKQAKIVATSPIAKDVVVTQKIVCKIQSRRQINVHALINGFIYDTLVKNGQLVRKGDSILEVLPLLDPDGLDAEVAQAQMELDRAEKRNQGDTVSRNEVMLYKAKLAKARARARSAITVVKAPFDGEVDGLHRLLGDEIKDDDIVARLSDNTVMRADFLFSAALYREYLASAKAHKADQEVELLRPDGTKQKPLGELVATLPDWTNKAGEIAVRADFANPGGKLRHGQSGTILIHRRAHQAVVVPLRAAQEVMGKRNVYVIDKEDVVHRREIVVQVETDDLVIIKEGVGINDRVILEGTHEVQDGQKVEYEYRPLQDVTGVTREKGAESSPRPEAADLR